MSRLSVLKILDVSDCDSMEHIVGKGEEEEEEDKKGAMTQTVNVLFPQLVRLWLENLQNLTSFLNGKEYTLEWMSMKEIILEDCPSMKTFSRGIISHDYLFNEDVNSVKLDRLVIRKLDCEIIWHCKTQATVEDMTVSGCHKLKNVFASSHAGIKMSESLKVSECDSLDVLFQFDCEQGIDSALLDNGLKDLELRFLPKLANICNMSPREHHPCHANIEAALTKDLKTLCLHHCPRLQRVFSLSSTTSSYLFPKLYDLDIGNCSMMREIFAEEEIDDESATPIASSMMNRSGVLFPELRHLKLENNANLERIFKGSDAYNAIEFLLEEITINGCPKLGPSSFYFSLLNSSMLRSADIVIDNQKVSVSKSPWYDLTFVTEMDEMRQPAFLMSVDGMDILMDMLMFDWKSTQPGCIPGIRSLELQNLLNFPAAALLHFIQSLPKLKKLHISNCGSVEVIFGLDQGLNAMKLPLLTELKLTSLEKLACIWMKGIPEILSQRFQNLRELHVGHCHSLKNLLAPSMAKHLVNLTTLTVENCSMVEEIVSVEAICASTEGKVIEEIGAQEDEGDEISTKTIEIFPQLNNLTLENLPNFSRFCATQGYTFNWLSLERVVVSCCPRLETFTSAVPNTPMLKKGNNNSRSTLW